MEQLREHPLHTKLFFVLSLHQIDARREHIRLHGLSEPLHIVADGAVIAGFDWLAAAKLEGHRKIDVIVRHDLTHRGETAVKEEVIRYGLRRSDITDLERAACYQEFCRLARGRIRFGAGDTRDQVAAMLGLSLSGRSLHRLAALLDLPTAIRHAIIAKKISQRLGEHILALPIEKQEEIAGDVAAGKTGKEIRATYGLTERRSKPSPDVKLYRFLAQLRGLIGFLRREATDSLIQGRLGVQLLQVSDQLTAIVRQRRLDGQTGNATMPALPANVAVRPSANFNRP